MQWIECATVFVIGLCINFARNLPPFDPIAAIGGFLYATGVTFDLIIFNSECLGNIASVPIVDAIGIGVGMLIWGSIQVITGWVVARFGLFGINAQVGDQMNVACISY